MPTSYWARARSAWRRPGISRRPATTSPSSSGRPQAAMETSWGNGGVIHASEVEPWSQPGMPRKILEMARQGERAAAAALRRDSRTCGAGASPSPATARRRSSRRTPAANLELALYSLRSLQEIGAETGIAYDRATSGVLKIYRSRDSLDAAQRVLRHPGAARADLRARSTSQRCVELEPALARHSGTLAGALYFRARRGRRLQQVHAGARRRLRRAAACVYRYGDDGARASRQPSGKVRAWSPTSGGASPPTRSSSRMGSFTAPLLAKLGIRVPIYPVKGISITFPRGGWNARPRMPVIDDSKLFGLVPIGDRMRISGSAEITGYDTTPAMAARRGDHRQRQLHFPELTRPSRPRQGAASGRGCGRSARPARRSSGRRAIKGPVDQRRPRPSRLDPLLRIGPRRRRPDRGPRSRHCPPRVEKRHPGEGGVG